MGDAWERKPSEVSAAVNLGAHHLPKTQATATPKFHCKCCTQNHSELHPTQAGTNDPARAHSPTVSLTGITIYHAVMPCLVWSSACVLKGSCTIPGLSSTLYKRTHAVRVASFTRVTNLIARLAGCKQTGARVLIKQSIS